MWLKLPQTMAATTSAVVAKQAKTRSMAMLGVCSAAMARRGAADPKQSACGDAEAMSHPRENGCFPGLWQEGWTTLGLNSALPGRLWMKTKSVAMGPQRKAQRFAHVAAREQRPRGCLYH